MDAKALKRVPLFSELGRGQRKVVARHADQVDIDAGTAIMAKGQLAYEMFVIVSGTADVLDEDGQVIARLGPGDVVGEIGVLKTHKRTADVVASSPLRAIVLYGPEFTALEKQVPEVFAALTSLVRQRTGD